MALNFRGVVHIRKHSAFFAITVLLAYFYIAQTSIENKHTHFYPNGVVITHSHPVDHSNNEPINHHGHTKTEICFFSTFHFDLYNVTDPICCDVALIEKSIEYHVFDNPVVLSEFVVTSDPRGPPSFDVNA